MATSMGPEHDHQDLDAFQDLTMREINELRMLTEEQREELKPKIGHSGDLGLEKPFDPDSKISDSPISDADDMPQTMDYTDDERALAREVQAKEAIGRDVKKGVSKKTKLGVIAGAVGLAAVGLIAALTGKGGDSDEQDIRMGLDDVNSEVQPEETTATFQDIGQDYRPEEEKAAEYSPIIAQGTNPQSVVEDIYKNLEKGNEERETSYITYYAFDVNSSYALSLKSNIEGLDNHYPVTVNVNVLEDYGVSEGKWFLRIEKQLEVFKFDEESGEYETFFTEDPQVRDLILQEKAFRVEGPDGQYVENLGWTILSDNIATNP